MRRVSMLAPLFSAPESLHGSLDFSRLRCKGTVLLLDRDLFLELLGYQKYVKQSLVLPYR